MPTAATPDTVIRQIVDAMQTLAGPHPGFRPVHAKGLVCAGTFRGSAGAAGILGRPISLVNRSRLSSGSPIATGIRTYTMVSPAFGRWR
jgi:catalase